jgi:putative ubiquitin-RnfH superfamily antitoxin RatB of RatAB toxin-antitoxin module
MEAEAPVSDRIAVEVVFGRPDSQTLITLSLEQGATVAAAIASSGLAENYPDEPIADLPVGIWGRVVDRERVLIDGDRIEIYRALQLEPREARRRLAQLGLTMRETQRKSGGT